MSARDDKQPGEGGKAAREGCTVSELPERDVKAISEIDALCEEVFRG